MLLPTYKINKKKTDFYERETYIDIFNKELTNVKKDNINLLMYYGVGGIGKTTLLKHLYDNHTNNNIKILINLEEYSNPLNFYSKLILELHKSNIKLFNFKIAFAIYWNKLNPNLAMKENEAFKGEWETLIPIIDQIGFGVGSIFRALYDYKDEFKKKFFNNYKMELEELENMNYKEIEILLPKFLNYDLNFNMENREETIIFFLDTHEYLFEHNKKENNKIKCDSFIKDVILSTFELNTLFVITGREKLNWYKENQEWENYIKHIELNSISKEASIKYLKDNGVKEDDIIEHIINYTDCVPFYLNLELNLYLKLENPTINDFNKSKTLKDIFNRFMLYADNNELQLLKVLAFSKKFNIELFEAIIKEFNIPVSILMFEDLVSNSYITQIDDEYFSLHNLMKTSIKDSVQDILKRKINTFLFNYYENNVLEQMNYIFEIKSLQEIYQFIKEKSRILSNDILLVERLYEIVFNHYYKNILKLLKKEDFNDIYSTNRIGLHENEDVKTYFLVYVDLGMIYLKYNNKIDFNELNTNSFKDIKINSYLYNLKNYLFLGYILKNQNHYKKTKDFISKIDINKLPLNYKIAIQIDIANFYRKNGKYKEAEEIFDDLEFNFFNMNNQHKFQFFMKKGFLLKNYNEYKKAIEIFNKAKEFIQNKDDEGKLYRALGELSVLSNELSLAGEYFTKSVYSFDSLYGPLNKESAICFKLLLKYDLEINDFYFLVFNLLNKKESNINEGLNKLFDIIEREKNVLMIENIFSIITKSLYDSNINIDLTKFINLVERKCENKTNIYLSLFMYYQKFNKDLAFKYISEAYKSSKINNLLKLIAHNYDSKIFFDNFEEDYNKLNNNLKFEILFNLKDYDKYFDLFIKLKNTSYLNYILKLNIDIIVCYINILENQYYDKYLDILYSNIIDFYYPNFDKNKLVIEEYLIKQMQLREKFNLENLHKGYSYLGTFYKKVNNLDLANFYINKAISLLDINKDSKTINVLEKIIKK